MTADICGRGVITTANPTGGSHSALLQKQMSFKTSVGANQLSKADEIEVIESGHNDGSSTHYSKVYKYVCFNIFIPISILVLLYFCTSILYITKIVKKKIYYYFGLFSWKKKLTNF